MDQKLNFLVVDDDQVDRIRVKRSLEKAGFDLEITEACSAEMAIELLHQKSFDFCFLDYSLPDSDGLALLTTLREQQLKIPLVVLTGQGDEQIAVALMKAGATDYLNKSAVKPDTLRETVNRALRLYKAEQYAQFAEEKLRITNELLRQQNETLKQQTQKIEAQNRELVEAARLKSEFMATVSHELRTPMNSVLGFSQVLQQQIHGKLNEQQLKMVSRIVNNSQQLQRLIDDLLDFSRIDAGGLQFKLSRFDVCHLMTEIVDEFRPMADQKSIVLTIDYDLNLTQIIHDPVRLKQILTNLLSNAIKFTDSGKVRVWLSPYQSMESSTKKKADSSLELVEQPPAWMILGVQDTGIGIDLAYQDSIFDPFLQLDQGLTRKQAGTGLGLSIVTSLVKLMGGYIWLRSVMGKGSTFEVVLPCNLA
jgi:signal transduction histidine kinase